MHLKFANRNAALHETLGSIAQPFTLPAAQLTGSSLVRTIQNSRFVLLGKQISALKTRVRARANLAKIPLAEGLSQGHMPRVFASLASVPRKDKVCPRNCGPSPSDSVQLLKPRERMRIS